MSKPMSGKLNNQIEECVRNNVTWPNLPIHLKMVRFSINCYKYYFDSRNREQSKREREREYKTKLSTKFDSINQNYLACAV